MERRNIDVIRDSGFYETPTIVSEMPNDQTMTIHNDSDHPGGDSGGGTIDVILCVNGEPFNVTIVGEIGGPV